MIIKKNLNFKNLKNKKVNISIGAFESLHRGHLKIIKNLINESKKDKALSTVITFKNKILKNYKEIILPLLERINSFKKLGIDILVLLDLKKIKNLSAEKFLKKISSIFIINKFIIGKDFKFGKNRYGDAQFIKKNNFKVKIIKLLFYNGEKISTSKIKELIKSGEIEKANKLLGYDYSIKGKVIHGEKLGSKIGFPTINLKLTHKNQLLPGNGVYLSFVKINNKIYPAMTYIGKKYVGKLKNKYIIESHILNFNKNIYYKKVEIFFKKKLRNEIKFSNIEELKNELKNDKIKLIAEVKKYGTNKIVKERDY